MPIKIGIAVLLLLGIAFFAWFKFSPFKQVPNLIPNPSQQNPSQQTSKKGLESHEMPKLLDIEVKSGVDQEYANKTLEGFKIMDFYLNKWFGKSITRKSSIRIEVTSEDNKWVEEDDGTAVYLNRTLSGESQMIERFVSQFHMDTRSRLMAHEYVHLFQFNNGCLHPGKTAGRTIIGEYAEKARWFLEGEAEWLSYKAFEESGNLSPFFSNGRWVSFYMFQIGDSVKPLQAYDQGENPLNMYSYFTVAVDFLMKNRDIKTLNDFCVNLGKKQDVPVAFQNAFGVSFEKFRSDFEAYFTKTFSKSVKEGGVPPSGGGDQSQIPQGYSSWAEFCKAQPKDSRCMTNKP